jgi:hypothetical protein
MDAQTGRMTAARMQEQVRVEQRIKQAEAEKRAAAVEQLAESNKNWNRQRQELEERCNVRGGPACTCASTCGP